MIAAINRAAPACLVLVLLSLAGVAFWGALSAHDQTDAAQVDALHSQLYDEARFDVSSQLSMQRDLQLHIHEQAAQASFDRTVQSLRRVLTAIDRLGKAKDHVRVHGLLREESRYVRNASHAFDLVRRGKHGLADAFIRSVVEPEIDNMVAVIDAAADSHRRSSAAQLASLNDTHRRILIITVIAFAIGILVIGGLTWVMRINRQSVRRAEETERTRLAEAAFTDPVTGIGNHRSFQSDLATISAAAARHELELSLALIDIDDFKLVNDLHGHSHGDQVLSTLATLLRSQRVEDRPFRLGGDEFAMVLPYTSSIEATIAMERLRVAAEKELIGATVSIGIADTGRDGEAIDGLRERADAALYEAKRRGRNTVVSFDEIRSSTSIVSTAKIMAVRRILANRSIGIVFQPIWNMSVKTLIGHEALMRPLDEKELTEPQEAFDIAEKLGRAAELDQMCRDVILARASELPPETLLFINVSPQTLDHSQLAGDDLLNAVKAVGLPPGRVVFEITERSIARLDLVVRQATRLRELGFRLALDDVGAGNAGLEMLRAVPVDFVKIDHSVIVDSLTDNGAFAVLTGIIAFARRAKTFVIAEGIETPAMLEVVRAASVPEGGSADDLQGVQGFLFGEPSQSPTAATAALAT